MSASRQPLTVYARDTLVQMPQTSAVVRRLWSLNKTLYFASTGSSASLKAAGSQSTAHFGEL